MTALRGNDRAWYREQYKWIRSQVDEFSGGHPQTDNIALLALADALAEVYVFSPGACDWELAVGGALANAYWLVTNATDADGGDTDLKAIQYVADRLSRNEMHFSDTCEDDRLERHGATEQHRDGLGFDWLVISSALTEALNRGNYDRTKTLARMFDEGIVAAGTKGYVRQRRIGESAHRTYCVVIDNNALEMFVSEHAPRLTVLKVVGADIHAHAPARPRAGDCTRILGETVRQAAKPQVRRGLLGFWGMSRQGIRQVRRRA